MAFFEVQNLFFKYNDHWVLEDISFKGGKGELIAVVGPSGCGKTTLLRILVGILIPQRGSAFVNEMNILEKSIETRNIGYVPQNQSLFPHQNVYNNIAFGLSAKKWPKTEIEKRVLKLAEMGGIGKMLKRRPHELSGGQQQRVALMRALAPSPQLLLLDEPLSNVDVQLREQLAIYIKNIQKLASITTLFVTHDLNEAKMLADKLIVMNEGKIEQLGSPYDVVLNPGSIDTARTLGLKNVFKITSLSIDELKQNVNLTTEIGKFNIPNHSINHSWEKARGIYIDPTKIQVYKAPTSDTTLFVGDILANIPEPMIHQSTLLIKVRIPNNEEKMDDIFSIKEQSKILRVQIPINESEYQIDDEVWIKIPVNSIKLYK